MNPNRRFDPSTARFTLKMNELPGCIPDKRWISEDGGIRSVLFYTDGAASNNGQVGVRAGYGVVLYPECSLSWALERVPGYPITSNRAELRAAHVSLGLRAWHGEGFKRVVIGTDSEYLVKGISEYVFKWQQNGWINARGAAVANKDLWLMLLDKIQQLANRGTRVEFWLIPREQNQLADQAAKRGAVSPYYLDRFVSFTVWIPRRCLKIKRSLEKDFTYLLFPFSPCNWPW